MPPPNPLTFDLNGLHVPKPSPTKPGGDEGTPQRLAVNSFTVICDSREQLPYEFTGMTDKNGKALLVPTKIKGLASGDYSIEGMEDRLAIERKSLDDLYGSVTWGRDRFEREIIRLNEMGNGERTRHFSAVVIEATWPEIVAPAEHRPGWENRTDPRSVEGTIIAWSIRYPRVSWWACGDRRGAECRTFSILRAFWKEQQHR